MSFTAPARPARAPRMAALLTLDLSSGPPAQKSRELIASFSPSPAQHGLQPKMQDALLLAFLLCCFRTLPNSRER